MTANFVGDIAKCEETVSERKVRLSSVGQHSFEKGSREGTIGD